MSSATALFEEDKRAWRWPAGVVAAGVILLLCTAGVGELQMDAPMYAFIAKRVAATGQWSGLFYDWEGEAPYFRKPPVMFWLTAGLMRLFGQEVWVTRVVPAVAYIASSLLLAAVVRRQYATAAGAAGVVAWTAAGAMVVQREVLGNVLEVRMDGGLMVTSLLASLGILRLMAAGNRRDRLLGYLVVGVGVGAGLMVRGGLAALAIPVMVAAVLWSGRGRNLLSPLGWLILFGVAAVIASPWQLWQLAQWGETARAELRSDLLEQHFRGSDRGWFFLLTYYVRRVPEAYALWLVPAVAGAWVWWRRRGAAVGDSQTRASVLGPVDRLAIVWLVVTFVSIHLTPRRAPQYFLLMYPWLAVLAAVGLAYAHAGVARWWARWGWATLPAAAAALALATVIPAAITGKGIAGQSMPELRTAAAVMRREAGVTGQSVPPDRPVVWMPAQGREHWQRADLVQFHTGLRVNQWITPTPMLPPPGDYVVLFNDIKLETVALPTLKLQEISRGPRATIYKVLPSE